MPGFLGSGGRWGPGTWTRPENRGSQRRLADVQRRNSARFECRLHPKTRRRFLLSFVRLAPSPNSGDRFRNPRKRQLSRAFPIID